ncbi:cytochrome c [Paracoccus aurantiacus]|uniref:Cytochrome c n=1 Tax=Paracoccus aurantiacus TaxID=2599412 RepID=A0A5C6S6C1_9RHOB|nr:cytochrome c [Paracoccus aurantiacus]TXB70080.1 cytochrome c [Paracoccus aurantiacus]
MRQLILASAIAIIPSITLADAAEDAIEAREGYMKMLQINMGTLAGMAKGEIDYDAEAATTAGNNIETLSNYTLPALFIEGTSPDDGVETEALPAIWENSEDFATKFAGLQEAATGAGAAAGGGQEALGPLLQKLGGACKACHDDYRKD